MLCPYVYSTNKSSQRNLQLGYVERNMAGNRVGGSNCTVKPVQRAK